MKRKLLSLLGIPLLLIFLVFVLPWLVIGIGFQLLPNPPIPEIKQGEFPFKLVYELNGEQIIVEDTIICKYNGIAAGSNGKSLKWKKFLANNPKETDVLLKIEGERKIYYAVGDANYYLGAVEDDMYFKNYDSQQFSTVFYQEPNEVGGISSGGISENDLLEEYGIKLISWKPSPPITNTFK